MSARLASAGYSGTPLARKLGIRPGDRLVPLHAPPGYADWLEPLPADVSLGRRVSSTTDLVHLFVTDRRDLERGVGRLRQCLRPEVPVWVSWPKKSSGVPSSVTEDVVREVALPLGFVDVKVCAVSDVWSGLKLVVRKALRP